VPIIRYKPEVEAPSRVEQLVSPFGVIAGLRPFPAIRGLDRINAFNSSVGSGTPGDGVQAADVIMSLGPAFDDVSQARLVAIAEGAERYASAILPDECLRWGAGTELDGAVIDPATIPRCSDTERTNIGSRYEPFDPGQEMRWVRAVDLATGVRTWIPAVMASYRLRPLRRSERFWHQITTGCAAHTSLAEAVVRGICEVAERDAVAVAWLQKLSLPELRLDGAPERLAYLLDWCDQHYIDVHLFDATNDLNIPAVYCLTIADHDNRARQVMASAAGPLIARAAEKALLEAIYLRVHLGVRDRALPADFAHFTNVVDGANYMARPERAGAFDFLLAGGQAGKSLGPGAAETGPVETLRRLVGIFAAKKIKVYALDQTTHELRAVGLSAATVVIPALQPMTIFPLMQYRAHERLYAAPALMGYRSLPEEELNPWPQPCA
jgi:ribosomal protein S12 methylthiotransferase accessory factor